MPHFMLARVICARPSTYPPSLPPSAVGKLNGIGEKMAAKLERAAVLLEGLGLPVPAGGIRTGALDAACPAVLDSAGTAH